MRTEFAAGPTPDAEYEAWRNNWTPPPTPIRVNRKKVLLEFGPHANRGTIFLPGSVGYNAKVIFDGTGELRCGAEVALEGAAAEQFEHDGRIVAIVDKRDILMEVLD